MDINYRLTRKVIDSLLQEYTKDRMEQFADNLDTPQREVWHDFTSRVGSTDSLSIDELRSLAGNIKGKLDGKKQALLAAALDRFEDWYNQLRQRVNA